MLEPRPERKPFTADLEFRAYRRHQRLEQRLSPVKVTYSAVADLY
jgi:hypothetical protein